MRRAYEQTHVAPPPDPHHTSKSPFIDIPKPMTPEQFAYWVRGIAESQPHSQLVSPHLVDRILHAARNLR